jgi:uncharacterized protein (DUF58 family)
VTNTFRIILFLLLMSILAGGITGNPLYLRLSYLWVFVIISSGAMSFFSLRGLRVNRRTSTLRSQVGQVFEERFEVVNPSRFPRLWVEVRDKSSLPDAAGSHVLTLVGGRESRTYLARTRLVERGVFPLGPTVLASGDIFGMFPVSREFPSEESLLVLPMMVDIHAFPHPPGLLPGGEALRRRTTQITSNAAGIREYEPGDPLNRIHWLNTARRDRLMVKEFELDPLADVWIIVDAAYNEHFSKPYHPKKFDARDIWRSQFIYELPPSTLEYTVTAAASLARYYLQIGRAVGLVYAENSLRIIPSDRGGRQLGKILESLALLSSKGNYPLEGLVEAQARHLPRGSTVVILTPNTTETVYRIADMLIRRGLRPVMVLMDTYSFRGENPVSLIEDQLQRLSVLLYVIRDGDDLTEKLSSVATI